MLPAEALESWRAAELRVRDSTDPLSRWNRWLDCLAARANCSGGRLAGLLIDLELCTLEHIEACVLAQLDAGRLDDATIRYDVEADLWTLQDRGSIEQLERLSGAFAAGEWASELSLIEHLHVALADRLLACGQSERVFAVLERVHWHLPLLGWLDRQHAQLDASLLERVAAHTWATVEACHLPPEYHVGLFTELAVLTSDPERLAHARTLALSLPPEQLAVTPDHPYLPEDLASGLARLGRYDEAERMIAEFAPEDRFAALLRLLPTAPDPDARARLIDGILGLVGPLEQPWSWVVEAAPETGPAAIAAIREIPDPDQRLDELCGVIHYLAADSAPSACVEAIELREQARHEPGSKLWVSGWAALLDALTAAGCEALLDPAAGRELIETLLADPEIDLWREAAGWIPDELALAVLERSSAGLAAATHYLDREAWIELGGRVLDRVAPDHAAAWRSVAAVAAVGTPFDRGAADKLGLFSREQQREIVLARLSQHRREFVPEQVFGRWLATLGWTVPVSLWRRAAPRLAAIEPEVLARQLDRDDPITTMPSPDPSERARDLASFEQLTHDLAWPSEEQRSGALALLYRGAGEDAWIEAIAKLASLQSTAISVNR